MLLTKKTILIIVGIMVPFILIIYFAMDNLILSGFYSLENKATENNLLRAERAIEARLQSLDRLAEDWSNWDDTYYYALNEEPAYIDNNMMDETFSSIRLNLMMIFSNEARLLFAKAYDFNNLLEVPIPGELQTGMLMDQFSGVLEGKTLSGIIITPEFPMLIVLKPIYDNYGQGPATGVLATGIFMDETMINNLSQTTDLFLTVHKIHDTNSPADVAAAVDQLNLSQTSYVQPLKDNRIGGYGLLMDIYGNPSLVLKVDLPRDITSQGRTVIAYINSVLLVLSIVFIISFIIILKKLIISRIITLDHAVQEISRTGDKTRRISNPGQDELSSLSSNINTMLASLERADHEVQALYQQEKKHREDLEAEANARSQFINVLAHELRTPLTPMLVSVEMVREMLKSKPDSVQYKLINTALSSVHALRTRLEELLELARFSRGAIKLNKRLVNTSEFLDASISRFKPAFLQKNQHLQIEIPDGLPKINADTSRLEQVLINLLSNAGKYSPADSIITIRATADSANLLIDVKDEGVGVPAEEQGKLFTPYHRAQQDRQSYPGIGLGLAVSSQIIQAHGGKIWVESERGIGSSFKFTLPLLPDTSYNENSQKNKPDTDTTNNDHS